VDSAEGFASLPAAAEPPNSLARLAAVAAAVIVGVCAGAASPSQAFFGMRKSGEIMAGKGGGRRGGGPQMRQRKRTQRRRAQRRQRKRRQRRRTQRRQGRERVA